MSGSFQKFLSDALPKGAKDLIVALNRLPDDKRSWTPEPCSRSAIDMVAECAILGGTIAQILRERAFPLDFDMAKFMVEKADLQSDEAATIALLEANTAQLVAAISSLPEDDLEEVVALPWGEMTMMQIANYPSWNLSYHEGQINYIASILGCLN